MDLIANHCQLLGRTCDLCQRFMYDDKGEDLSGEQRTNRFGKPIARPPGAPTPCSFCVKGNPIDGRRIDRLVPLASELIRVRGLVRSTSGQILRDEDKADDTFCDLLTVVDQEIRLAEARYEATITASTIARLMVK